MLCIPSSLNELLLLFRPCFTQPSFQTFTALVVGQIAQTRLRCVTGMLLGARLSRVWHHARAHRFFSHARWSADELGLAIAGVIVERLLPADAPLVVPVDDSLFKRRGRKIFGCAWDRDPTANSRRGRSRGVTAGSRPGSTSSCHSLSGRSACWCCSGSGGRGIPNTSRPSTPIHSGRPSPSWPGKSCACSPSASPAGRSTSLATQPMPPKRSPACRPTSRSPPGCAASSALRR
jgi:hypothetical protein